MADIPEGRLIGQWFSILTRKLLRRGSFESQEDLENQVTEFTIGYNKTARPWKWTYDADAEHARCLIGGLSVLRQGHACRGSPAALGDGLVAEPL
jgi:hypothetical protein